MDHPVAAIGDEGSIQRRVPGTGIGLHVRPDAGKSELQQDALHASFARTVVTESERALASFSLQLADTTLQVHVLQDVSGGDFLQVAPSVAHGALLAVASYHGPTGSAVLRGLLRRGHCPMMSVRLPMKLSSA